MHIYYSPGKSSASQLQNAKKKKKKTSYSFPSKYILYLSEIVQEIFIFKIYHFWLGCCSTVPIKLYTSFLGRINLEMNLFETLFSNQVAEAGVWVEAAAQTNVWHWGVCTKAGRARWGQMVSPWAARGLVSEDLGGESSWGRGFLMRWKLLGDEEVSETHLNSVFSDAHKKAEWLIVIFYWSCRGNKANSLNN